MADLSASKRKSMPKKEFGLPSRAKTDKGKAKPGSFPMPDKKHARLAISMAAKSLKAGNISKAQHDQVVARAHKKLGTDKKK